MAVWPFNHKKKQDETLPDEVKDLYESGGKKQSGMAWLLALATLVVTILLALLLFFGGRWIYQKLANDDAPNDGEQTTQQEPNNETAKDQPTEQEAVQQGSSSTSTDNTAGQTLPGSTEETSTPTTGTTELEIPNTGPGPEGLL